MMPRRLIRRSVMGLALCLAAPALAAGQSLLAVDPPQLALLGRSAQYQLLVEERLADGQIADRTAAAVYKSTAEAVVSVSPGGVVAAHSDGEATIHIEFAGQKIAAAIRVEQSGQSPPASFEQNVAPVLARFGCNTSGCHGKAEGQNGFKLSVFGFDPKADFDALTKEGRGRRLFLPEADRSLLLLKATGATPHGGGARLPRQSIHYEQLKQWIEEGAPYGDPKGPKVVSLTITPARRVMATGASQQLRAVATYSDGREADVTALAKFQTNREAVAAVSEMGLVTTGRLPGPAAIMANFMGAVDTFHVLTPRTEPLAAAAAPASFNFVDEHVNRQLTALRVAPSAACSDADFLRRVSLDLIGALPTAEEARAYLSDTRPDRRALLVEALLKRPEFADYWALKWSDVLRVDRRALGHREAYAYYRWLRTALAENRPLDVMTRDLLTAEGPLVEAPQGAFFKAVPEAGKMASTVAQVFLGVRIACAECHHHPFDRWTPADYAGMQAFFQQVSRRQSPLGEIVVAEGNPQTAVARTGQIVQAFPLGEPMPEKTPEGDRRRLFADWLTQPNNAYFARNMANRLWAHFLGRGIVEPVDDIRDTNPPTNAPLLDALAKHLVDNKYDAQQLMRAIIASAAYQRSTEPTASNADDELNYSRFLFKSLPAEVLLDAVCQVTGSPEKFDGVPAGSKAVQLWDSRVDHDFLRRFGRPVRETSCECERVAEPNLAQVLHLLNAPQLQAKLEHESGRVAQLTRRSADDSSLVDDIYLSSYSRLPSDAERAAALETIRTAPGGRRQGAEDLLWSLLNTLEFVFNH